MDPQIPTNEYVKHREPRAMGGSGSYIQMLEKSEQRSALRQSMLASRGRLDDATLFLSSLALGCSISISTSWTNRSCRVQRPGSAGDHYCG